MRTAGETMHARGTFDVRITPVANDEADGSSLGRMTMTKEFHGELEDRPGLGNGDLSGIRGTMTVTIDGGAHSYQLTYTLRSADV